MAEIPAVVVDVHSHVFNADDLPIAGFVEHKVDGWPRLLAAPIGVLLDALAQAQAPGVEERHVIEDLLAGRQSLAAAAVQRPDFGDAAEVVLDGWQREGLPVPPRLGLAGPSEEQVVAALEQAPPEEHYAEALGQPAAEAFFGRNALRYLGLTGEDDEPAADNQNRKRLEAWYGDAARPPWLPVL